MIVSRIDIILAFLVLERHDAYRHDTRTIAYYKIIFMTLKHQDENISDWISMGDSINVVDYLDISLFWQNPILPYKKFNFCQIMLVLCVMYKTRTRWRL